MFGLRRIALRLLPVSPDQYWRLTPVELSEMIEGAVQRDEREWERAAWITAYLLNISGKSMKRDITADELLGRPRRIRVRDFDANFESLWAEIERLRAEGKMPEE